MKTVWLIIAAVLAVSLPGVLSAATAKRSDILLYDAKPGEKIGDMRINPKDGAEMVWVPAGEFLMGSTDEQVAEFDVEKPQRIIYLDGYWIYKYPVTVAQYRKFCEDTDRSMPTAPNWGWKDDHPFVNISWQDAADYANWARSSLPTEAQWEKAARGTDGRIHPWGNEWDAAKCANSVKKKLNSTQPVDSYPAGASPYGAMDMAGNVWEWCADWYDPDYYKSAPKRNPTGPSAAVEFTVPGFQKVAPARALRGGSWNFYCSGFNFRCAYRNSKSPNYSYNFVGFRCVSTP